jgi:hypothetical protein
VSSDGVGDAAREVGAHLAGALIEGDVEVRALDLLGRNERVLGHEEVAVGGDELAGEVTAVALALSLERASLLLNKRRPQRARVLVVSKAERETGNVLAEVTHRDVLQRKRSGGRHRKGHVRRGGGGSRSAARVAIAKGNGPQAA